MTMKEVLESLLRELPPELEGVAAQLLRALIDGRTSPQDALDRAARDALAAYAQQRLDRALSKGEG